jgi:iron complex outermembrane recepter protein
MKKLILLNMLISAFLAVAGQYSLKGTVTDQNDQPLPGATVVLENSYYGISSGADGKFEFRHLKPGEVRLVVSFIGYETDKQSLMLSGDREVQIRLKPRTVYTEEVLVEASRAHDRMPVTYTNLSAESLQNTNQGQDLPYVLATTPSFIASSDAGTGIGYTSFRIRGTDMNRINVTVNGIPLNDAESHATFFVDQPDLTTSAADIQIQRGAGTSANGGAAFGATINLQTLTLNPEPYGSVLTTAGSFNTLRNTVSAGTGLLRKRVSLDVRLSKIKSAGFIDRARSDLKSFFVSGGYYGENTVLKANIWSGWEETYQAWNGVPSVRLNSDMAGMLRYEEHGLYSHGETEKMIASDPRTYNLYTYKNQVDHYQQDHYMLHFSQRFSPAASFSLAGHYTYGRGYYEEYRTGDKLANYNLPAWSIGGNAVSRSDLIRRKWLDNDFYGSVASFVYRKERVEINVGGGWNRYVGRHFGRLIWAQYWVELPPEYEWYRNTGTKTDGNGYARMNYQIAANWNFFADLQVRLIRYRISGVDDDLRLLELEHNYHFFNPKTGLFFRVNPRHSLYLSVARTNREPNRDNFVDTPPGGELPRHETLTDVEGGWEFKSADQTFRVNLYDMFYHNQLALTGQINDVGAPVMTNVERSYRVGIEFQWGLKLISNLHWEGNMTLSSNKIRGFTEYVDDWDTGIQQQFHLGKTDLAFSPRLISNSQVSWQSGHFGVSLISAYISRQFIDNSSSTDRVLDPWFIHNLKLEYVIQAKLFRSIKIQLAVNNLFNAAYESNAWVYSYFLEGKRYKMDGYFPQAGINFLAGLDLAF